MSSSSSSDTTLPIEDEISKITKLYKTKIFNVNDTQPRFPITVIYEHTDPYELLTDHKQDSSHTLLKEDQVGDTNHPILRQQTILKELQQHEPIHLLELQLSCLKSQPVSIPGTTQAYQLFLLNAWKTAHAMKDKNWLRPQPNGQSAVVPYNFSPKTTPDCTSNLSEDQQRQTLADYSIYTLAGYYGTDTMSPIFEHTHKSVLGSAFNSIHAGSMAIYLQDLKINEKTKQGCVIYALNSSPGHHASLDTYAGYCFMNNAVIAVETICNRHPNAHCAILDLDYHFGDGTYHFYHRSTPAHPQYTGKARHVLTASLHMDPTYDYPYFSGYIQHSSKRIGNPFSPDAVNMYNHSIPLPPGCTWSEYQKVLNSMLQEIDLFFRDFMLSSDSTHPSYLIIPFGADTVEGDPDASPLGGMKLQISDYYEMGLLIRKKFPQQTIIVTQEGGYKMEVVGKIVQQFLKGLNEKI